MSGTGLEAGNKEGKLHLSPVDFATTRCVTSKPLSTTASAVDERMG